jgi:hypothetical protein
MSHSFQFLALAAEHFAPLFDKTDIELEAIGARRVVADEKPGFPCRVSLADAEIGETVLLLPFAHHDVESPYRALGPIFVRLGAGTATPAVGEVPAMLRHRLLSVRAYDAAGMMRRAEVVRGHELEPVLQRLFVCDEVRYLHVHNAGAGCYNCRVVCA